MSKPYPERFELDDDPGFMEVVLFGKEARVDVFAENNLLADLARQYGEANAFHGAVAGHLQFLLTLDAPPSLSVAARYLEAVRDRLDHVKKKLYGPPTSLLTSPDSIHSRSPESSAPPCSSTPGAPTLGSGWPESMSRTPTKEPS